MSLRKGHMRSKVWAPPTLRDDWRDEAKCTGMMTVHVPVETCDTCPVRTECGLLGVELEGVMQSGRKRNRQPMPGTYGGENTPEKLDHPNVGNKYSTGRYPKGAAPINGGDCSSLECTEAAYRRGMCSAHYQRMMRAR